MRRLLVTGAAGLLGGRLAELLAAEFARRRRPAPLARARADWPRSRWTSPRRRASSAAFDTMRPDAVLHAAVANADRCESDPAGSEAVNVRGTAVVAEACARRGARLVALSTDLVFASPARDGRADEADPPGPLLGYGRTKLAGEEEALRRCAGSAVARIALVCGRGFGPRGTSSEGVAWALRRGDRPRLFTDQWRTPVDAEAIADGPRPPAPRERAKGRYHLGGPERVSRYELGVRTAAAFGLAPGSIEAVSQATLSLGAAAPGRRQPRLAAARAASWVSPRGRSTR